MGKGNILKHSKSQFHQELAKSMKTQSQLNLSGPSSSEASKVIEAEVKMAVMAACNNIPLAFHDHLSPMIRSIFPDSRIALKYHSASTKATCMLNLAVAPMLKQTLVESMKFSISIDGSNDAGLKKMNPVMVRLFDSKECRIVTQFLDMCTTTSGTAKCLFHTLDGKLAELLQSSNPWNLCASVGVDNTSVNKN